MTESANPSPISRPSRTGPSVPTIVMLIMIPLAVAIYFSHLDNQKTTAMVSAGMTDKLTIIAFNEQKFEKTLTGDTNKRLNEIVNDQQQREEQRDAVYQKRFATTNQKLDQITKSLSRITAPTISGSVYSGEQFKPCSNAKPSGESGEWAVPRGRKTVHVLAINKAGEESIVIDLANGKRYGLSADCAWSDR